MISIKLFPICVACYTVQYGKRKIAYMVRRKNDTLTHKSFGVRLVIECVSYIVYKKSTSTTTIHHI